MDRIIGEWKAKVDALQADLDAAQRDVRMHNTDALKLRGALEEEREISDGLRRENKQLSGS